MTAKPSDLIDEIAALLETEPELLSLMPELLADLEALGGSPETLVGLLQSHLTPQPAWRVLDLGCGKGALSLAVCKSFGCQVVGVDAFAPFIEAARRKARKLGIEDRCTFVVGDLRRQLQPAVPYDLMVYAGLGDLLGSPNQTIGLIRTAVKPGGVIYLDDVLLKPGAARSPGYQYALDRSAMHRALTAHGDRIIAEEIQSAESLRAVNERNTAMIKLRAQSLILRLPEKAALIEAYVRRQERECANLESDLVGASWLISRGLRFLPITA